MTKRMHGAAPPGPLALAASCTMTACGSASIPALRPRAAGTPSTAAAVIPTPTHTATSVFGGGRGMTRYRGHERRQLRRPDDCEERDPAACRLHAPLSERGTRWGADHG